MTSNNYWVPWQAKDALIAFSQLKAEEIGVLIQIINLIYAREEPIENDPAYIGKQCNIQKAKCARIIETLIQKNHIYINEKGMISKNRCEEELEKIRKKRRKRSEDGKKGAESRWNNEQYQLDENATAISDDMAKIKTNNNHRNKTKTNGLAAGQEGGGNYKPYDIEIYLLEDDLEELKKHAPKWDIYALMKEYNQRINDGKKDPPHYPQQAFLAWVKVKTKGKPPP